MKARLISLSLALFLSTGSAFADHHGDHADHAAGHEAAAGHGDAAQHGDAAHGEAGHGDHGGGHGHGDHVPHFSDINWFHGMIGEKEGVEPNFFWRAPGTPVPLGALLLNTAILFFLIGRFGGPAITKGLASRKERIAGDIEKASKMKEEAEEQLAHYEGKLKEMEAEMDRIKAEMKEQAEADRSRILKEAAERRSALEAEARLMVEQELAQARHEATTKAVTSAVQAAREEIQKNLTAQDQERLARDLLGSLDSHLKKTTEAAS